MAQHVSTRADENRRKGIPLRGGIHRIIFQRILIAETIVVAMAMIVSFLLAYLIFAPGGHSAIGEYRLAISLVSMMLMVAVVMVLAAVRVSHRICGPMAKIRESLGDITRGKDPGQIKIRNDDDLHDLVDALNGALEQLRRDRTRAAREAPPVGAEVLSMISPDRSGNSQARAARQGTQGLGPADAQDSAR